MINTVNTDQIRGTNRSSNNSTLCTINICGLSERSHMMLNKYVCDNNIALLSVQETGTNKDFKKLDNMKTFEDTNHQSNKGCAIMVHSETMFTQFFDISRISKRVDSVWGMLCLGSKKFIIGNVYLKLDYPSGVKEFTTMLEKAYDLGKKHKCLGVIAMGDFNARHLIWNDSVTNRYGKLIEENLDWSKFSIHAPSSSTFLSKNGSSLIDFFVVLQKSQSSCYHFCYTFFLSGRFC